MKSWNSSHGSYGCSQDQLKASGGERHVRHGEPRHGERHGEPASAREPAV